jgi:hypothetical protein
LWGIRPKREGKEGGEDKRRRKEKEDSFIRIPNSNSAILFLGELFWPMDVKVMSFQTSPLGPRGVGELCLGLNEIWDFYR